MLCAPLTPGLRLIRAPPRCWRSEATLKAIPCSPEEPKILRRYHSEIICDCTAVFGPISRDFFAQELQSSLCEFFASVIGFVVRHVLVHDAPQPLDRVQMRAVGWQKMQLDAASGS